MVLGDSDCTCNFTCNGTTVESSKGKNILGITIDDKLTFSPHLGNIFKKVNKKLHAIGRIKCNRQNEFWIHKTYINYLMIEVYRHLHGLSPELMTDIFTLQKNPYNIRNIRLFGSENPQSVRFGVDAIPFRASQLWQKVPIAIKDSSSLQIFKAKIKLCSCVDCPCNLV